MLPVRELTYLVLHTHVSQTVAIICLAFGFNQSTFRAIEQGESYTIEIGFWSGTINDVVIGRVELTLEGTTSEFVA